MSRVYVFGIVLVIAFSLPCTKLHADETLNASQQQLFEQVTPALFCVWIDREDGRLYFNNGYGIVTANQRVVKNVEGQEKEFWITYILTAKHVLFVDNNLALSVVVRRSNYVEGKRTDYTSVSAKIESMSESLDLAVLTVETEREPFMPITIPFMLDPVLENKTLYTHGVEKDQGDLIKVVSGIHKKGEYRFQLPGLKPGEKVPVLTELLTTCLSRKGASGSVIMVLDGTNPIGVGIMTCVNTEKVRGPGFGLTCKQIRDFAQQQNLMHAFQFIDPSKTEVLAATE